MPALSSPFVGGFWKVVVVLRGSHLKEGKWSGYPHLKHSHFASYINPSITDSTRSSCEGWEQSIGYPGVRLLIDRPEKVKVSYNLPKKFDEREEELTGFTARIFQHHMDVL